MSETVHYLSTEEVWALDDAQEATSQPSPWLVGATACGHAIKTGPVVYLTADAVVRQDAAQSEYQQYAE